MIDNNRNIIKLVAIVLLTFLLLSIGYSIYNSISRSGKVQTVINLVPRDTILTLDGAKYKNGTNYISAGEYDLIASKEGFATFTRKITINEDSNQINIGLSPESKEATEWVSKNLKEYNLLENIQDTQTSIAGEKLVNQYPIIENLPYENYLYSIGYKFNSTKPEDKQLVVTIHTSEQYRQDALLQIERWGFNLADFNYEISDYTNPFKI